MNEVSLERKFPMESTVDNGVRICRKFPCVLERNGVVINGVVVEFARRSGVRINGAPTGNGLNCLGKAFGSR